MYGRAYQWLIMGSYSNYWWNTSDIDCNLDELEKAMESVIIADLLPLSTSGDITISGIVSIFGFFWQNIFAFDWLLEGFFYLLTIFASK